MRKLNVRRFTTKDVERINNRMILRGKGLLQEEEQHICVIRVTRPTLNITPQEIDAAGRRAMRKHVEKV